MRIIITMELDDVDANLTDPSAPAGLTVQGYRWMVNALWRFGEDIEISKDPDQD